jgi:hypothetical protein
MTGPITFQLGVPECPVDPPIIDHFFQEPESEAYSIRFVPTDELSKEETVFVSVPLESPEGRQIGTCHGELSKLLGGGRSIERIGHGGGGDFTFHLDDGTWRELSDPSFDQTVVQRAYELLQHMAQTAELALRVQLAGGTASEAARPKVVR